MGGRHCIICIFQPPMYFTAVEFPATSTGPLLLKDYGNSAELLTVRIEKYSGYLIEQPKYKINSSFQECGDYTALHEQRNGEACL